MDKKKLLIKGNKKIPIYKKSSTFSKNIKHYLNHVFVNEYKRKRIDKINTIIANVNKKFCQENFDFEGMKNFFLLNPKLKLPWSDSELLRA